jgi:hypothetical protein
MGVGGEYATISGVITGARGISRNRTSSHSTPVIGTITTAGPALKVVLVNRSSTPVDSAAPRSMTTQVAVDMLAKSALGRALERPLHHV